MIIKTERTACGRKIHRVFSHLPFPPRPSQEFPPSPSLPPDIFELRNPYLSPGALSLVSDAGRRGFEGYLSAGVLCLAALKCWRQGRDKAEMGMGAHHIPKWCFPLFQPQSNPGELCRAHLCRFVHFHEGLLQPGFSY